MLLREKSGEKIAATGSPIWRLRKCCGIGTWECERSKGASRLGSSKPAVELPTQPVEKSPFEKERTKTKINFMPAPKI
jgi:hypothetical protein